jgi:hypothetical protein
MKNRFISFASTRFALSIALGAATPPVVSGAPAGAASLYGPAIREVPFQLLESGARSGCVRPAKMVIGDEREWNRVWRVHNEKAAVPRIDFSRYRVVALLSGKGGAPLEIVQVASTRDEVTVFFHRGATVNSATTPFRFALIEKIGNAARFIDQDGKVCAVCHVLP